MTDLELTEILLDILENERYHLSYSSRENIVRQTLYRIKNKTSYSLTDIITHLEKQKRIQATFSKELIDNESYLTSSNLQAIFNFNNTFIIACAIESQPNFDLYAIGKEERFMQTEAIDSHIIHYTDGQDHKKAYCTSLTKIIPEFADTRINQEKGQILTEEVNRFLMYNPLFISDVFGQSRTRKPF